jgi:hypothetical protein
MFPFTPRWWGSLSVMKPTGSPRSGAFIIGPTAFFRVNVSVAANEGTSFAP